MATLSLAILAGAPSAGAVGPRSGAPAMAVSSGAAANRLPLGPADLPETRTTRTLQPGVTLTQITRGTESPALFWTLTVSVPATQSSPDPDAPPSVIVDATSARTTADRLRSQGYDVRVEQVRQPRTADVPAGVLGYRVRVGSYQGKDAATAAQQELAGAGTTSTVDFTGWDPDPTAGGPWHVNVLRIAPGRFEGRLQASYGPDIRDRETTSALAQAAGATAATNGGFFVLDPAAGAPGDPAGVGVYDGHVLSEPVGRRPALLLHPGAAHTAVVRPGWSGQAHLQGRWVRLDGIDRVPGLIRNCGGDRTDYPTRLPLHDFTCTDDGELVLVTPQYGPTTPPGPGREVVLNRRHRVVRVDRVRGTTLARGQSALQATGVYDRLLDRVRVGDRIRVSARLSHVPSRTRRTTLVNGGPLLLRGGHVHITQQRDGFVHPDDPSFAYGWFIRRNPRTFAGVDAHGRTVIVTVDGRSTTDLGLSIPETARVARSLGLVDAVNLDGGGSTAMVVDGALVNHPSDTTGERPVGDALLVLPNR